MYYLQQVYNKLTIIPIYYKRFYLPKILSLVLQNPKQKQYKPFELFFAHSKIKPKTTSHDVIQLTHHTASGTKDCGRSAKSLNPSIIIIIITALIPLMHKSTRKKKNEPKRANSSLLTRPCLLFCKRAYACRAWHHPFLSLLMQTPVVGCPKKEKKKRIDCARSKPLLGYRELRLGAIGTTSMGKESYLCLVMCDGDGLKLMD